MDLTLTQPFRLGALEAQPATLRVTWPGGGETLQPRVMQVLTTLARAEGEVVSRDTLVRECWDGRIVGEDAITRVFVKLRRLGGESGAFEIETIPKVGYRLTAPGGAAPIAAQTPTAARASRRAVLLTGGALATTVGVAGAGAYFWRRRAPAPAALLTIAVMPFDDLRPEPRTGYLAAGLAREVRNALSRVAGLRVIGDASSFALAGQGDAEVGRRLKAELLLKGALLQEGSRTRVTTELVEAATGVQVWADAQETGRADLFDLRGAVAASVIQQLIARVGPDRLHDTPRLRARDPEVFRIMLAADHLLEQTRALRMVGRETEALDAADEAQGMVDKALAIDPNDPGALVAQAAIVRNGWTRELAERPLTQAQRGAEAAAILRRALAVDGNDPSALAALADYYRRLEWRWAEAETLFRRALAIDPNHLEARWGYAYQLGSLGRALEALVHAKEVNALDPETVWRRLCLPRILYIAGARAAAMDLYAAELARNPDNVFLIRELYFIHLSESDGPGLLKLAADVARPGAPAGVEALRARAAAGAAALAGSPGDLLRIVDADVAAFDAGDGLAGTKQGRASADFLFIYAMEYGWAGQVAKSLALLDRALAAHSIYWPASLPYGVAQFPAAVRNDPGHDALWRRDPRRMEILKLRLTALKQGQGAGVFPDGKRFRPKIPEALWSGET